MKENVFVTKSRLWLLCLWGFFLILNISILVYMYYWPKIEIEDLEFGLNKLSKIYGPYLSIILAYFFGGTNRKKTDLFITFNDNARTIFWVAFAFSGLWNFFILVLTSRILFKVDYTVQEAFTSADYIVDYFPWLVSFSLGYYFINNNDSEKAGKNNDSEM